MALAEACALCCERLLALARSLSAHTRYGRPADDKIEWPKAPVPAAAMLRREVSQSACAERLWRMFHQHIHVMGGRQTSCRGMRQVLLTVYSA